MTEAPTIGYLTKRFPRLSETFILDEILGLEAAGVPLRLYAVADPREGIVQPDVTRVRSPVVYLRPSSGTAARVGAAAMVLGAHAQLLRRRPLAYIRVVGHILRKRRHMSTLRHFVNAGRLAVLLQRDGATHVHAAFANGPGSIVHLVHLLTGIPFSFAAHAKDLYLSAPDLLARKIEAASFVLACSESAARRLRELAGSSGAKVVLAPHGVDAQRFRPRETGEAAAEPATPGPGTPGTGTPDTGTPGTGTPGAAGTGTPDAGAGAAAPLRVLAVGRLVEKKGYPVLFEALGLLRARGVAFHCSVIGDGLCKEELMAERERLQLTGVLELLGSRTHHQIAQAYRDADVFVQASVVLANGDRDGTPNSLLEAMASGVPVVASAVAGIPEVVADGCGTLVPPGDPAALADALAAMAADPSRRRAVGAAARAHVLEHLERTACVRVVAALFLEREARDDASGAGELLGGRTAAAR